MLCPIYLVSDLKPHRYKVVVIGGNRSLGIIVDRSDTIVISADCEIEAKVGRHLLIHKLVEAISEVQRGEVQVGVSMCVCPKGHVGPVNIARG